MKVVRKYEPKHIRLGKWHKWFAWYPIEIYTDGFITTVWMESVYRKYYYYSNCVDVISIHYSLKKEKDY